MTRIKNYNQFISEEFVFIGPVGPAYGDTKLQNKTVSPMHTTAEHSKGLNNPDSNNPLTSDIFFDDQYSDVYNRYLKGGGSQSELTNDRGLNMKIMMDFLRGTQS